MNWKDFNIFSGTRFSHFGGRTISHPAHPCLSQSINLFCLKNFGNRTGPGVELRSPLKVIEAEYSDEVTYFHPHYYLLSVKKSVLSIFLVTIQLARPKLHAEHEE